MFCTQCGVGNPEDAKFCKDCGKPIKTSLESEKEFIQPKTEEILDTIAAKREDVRFYEPALKDSGIVTALSVIGFVFGLIGMFISFAPLLGMIAFMIGVPALGISLVSLFIAATGKTKKTFAIVAVTICSIGIALSYMQRSQFNSGVKWLEKDTQRMLGNLQNTPMKINPQNKSTTVAVQAQATSGITEKFCGVWKFQLYGIEGMYDYFKVSQSGPDTYVLMRANGKGSDGKILWMNTEDIMTGSGKYVQIPVKMKVINGGLVAKFTSFNFIPSHGNEIRCVVRLTALVNGDVKYVITANGDNKNPHISAVAHRIAKL